MTDAFKCEICKKFFSGEPTTRLIDGLLPRHLNLTFCKDCSCVIREEISHMSDTYGIAGDE